MHTITRIALMAVAMAAPLMAMEGDSAKPKAFNTECPMCSKPVGDNPAVVKMTLSDGSQTKSYYLAMCTEDCEMVMMKDPEAMLKKTFGKQAAGPKTQYK